MKAYFKLGFLSGFNEIPRANEFIYMPLPCPVNMTTSDYDASSVDVIKKVTFKLYKIDKFQGEDVAVYERYNQL